MPSHSDRRAWIRDDESAYRCSHTDTYRWSPGAALRSIQDAEALMLYVRAFCDSGHTTQDTRHRTHRTRAPSHLSELREAAHGDVHCDCMRGTKRDIVTVPNASIPDYLAMWHELMD